MSHTISSQLLEKYGIQGPRYFACTPTSLELTDQFSSHDLQRHITISNAALLPKPLALNIHALISPDLSQHYLNYLYREIELLTPNLAKDRLIKRIHLSSNAASCLNASQLREVFDVIARQFHLSYPEDLAISAQIDPRLTHQDKISQLATMGINRICIGVNEKSIERQKAVNKIPNLQQFETIIQTARKNGIQPISVALNVGLPDWTSEVFTETLTMLTDLGVDQIIFYNSAEHPERILSLRPLDSDTLSNWLTRITIMTDAINFLSEHNYVHLCMFQFALSEGSVAKAFNTNQFQLSFQGYYSHAEYDELGLGLGGISRIGDAYNQNTNALQTYCALLDGGQLPVHRGVTMNQDDLIRACVIQLIQCQGSVSFEAINTRFIIDFENYFEFELMQLSLFEEDGLLHIDNNQIVVTTNGRFFLRNISMVFERS